MITKSTLDSWYEIKTAKERRLESWLAKFRAKKEDIEEWSDGSLNITVEYDYGAGRILLPFEFQPEKIQDRMLLEKVAEDARREEIRRIVKLPLN